MNEVMRILLVEDEPEIGAVVVRGLEKAGYRVEWSGDGLSARGAAQNASFALIVLDLMLPGMDGWSLCRELRAARDTTPILMLTARDAVDDRVRGLEMGVDDYLSKPFAFPELLARVRALLRRDRVHKTPTIRIADLMVDTGARRVTRAGRELALTPREYLLLEALAAREGRVLTRDAISKGLSASRSCVRFRPTSTTPSSPARAAKSSATPTAPFPCASGSRKHPRCATAALIVLPAPLWQAA